MHINERNFSKIVGILNSSIMGIAGDYNRYIALLKSIITRQRKHY